MADATPRPEQWEPLVSYLGAGLVCYVLATDEMPDSDSFTSQQVEVAAALVAMFSGSDVDDWGPWRRWQDISSKLCRYDGDRSGSTATLFHYHCGGQRADTSSADQVEELLCRLAADAYPMFLVGGIHDGIPLPGVGVRDHPLFWETLREIFQPGEPLMALFPDADFSFDLKQNPEKLYGHNAAVRWSDGSASTISLTGIPDSILRTSNGAAQAGYTPMVAYVRSVRRSLATARALAERRDTEVPALAGCYSAALADGTLELSLDGARFRRKTPMDHELVGQSRQESVVIEVSTKFCIVQNLELDGNTWGLGTQAQQVAAEKFRDHLQDRISRARMAVLLASRDGETLAVGQSFLTIPNPLAQGGSWSRSPLAWPVAQFHSRPLSVEDEPAIQSWDALLGTIPQGLKTGQQRLLAAVSERYSPHDGFIDAVITWENLFGAKGDTSLRVCGSIARVLHPANAEESAAFYREAKVLYDKRSGLVHGGENRITQAEAVKFRDRAVHIAIDAWRSVLSSDRLREAKDSPERGNLVMIQGVM